VSWRGIEPDGNWSQLATPGIDLVWRSAHEWAAPGVNPGVTQLEVDWLLVAAAIDSVVDVPNDQGGFVRVYFTRSGRDFTGEPTYPVTAYDIYRRIDDTGLAARILDEAESAKKEKRPSLVSGIETAQIPSSNRDSEFVNLEGRRFLVSRSAAAAGFPPGIWEVVATVHALQKDQYVALAPTLEDSSSTYGYTVFTVTTHTTTPSIWYVSAPDSGYSVDNIAPAVPTSFVVAYNTGSGNQLSWDPCPDEDFQYFCVYRSNDPGFVPAPSDLVHTTTSTNWSDPDYDGWIVHYKITACDFMNNESDPTGPGTTTAVTEPVIPRAFALYQNIPNPFNPTTTIRYDVPGGGGNVTLRVYDVGGKLVRTLVDRVEEPGEKCVTWNGRNEQGSRVASGVYFYRMTTPGFEMTKKMVLLQ
jgi:hypothetical protein